MRQVSHAPFAGEAADLLSPQPGSDTWVMLEAAAHIDGWMTKPELAFLYSIGLSMPDGAVVVEVGSWKGRSTVAIAEGIAGKNARLVSVDTFRGDAAIGAHDPEEILAEFRRNTAHVGFLETIVSDSVDAAASVPDRSLDWLFIDADHSYDGVRTDLAAWAPKLKPGGLMSGHDYGRGGVTLAVDRMFRSVGVWQSIWFTRNPVSFRPVARLRATLRRASAR